MFKLSLLLVFLYSLKFSAFSQVDFAIPDEIKASSSAAKKKGELTSEFTIDINTGDAKEIAKAWENFLKTSYNFKLKGLGKNVNGYDLIHASWGTNAFNMKADVSDQNGTSELIVLLYPVKEDRNNEDENELNAALNYLPQVMHDFAKNYYITKIQQNIDFQEKVIKKDLATLNTLSKKKKAQEKSIEKNANMIKRIDKRKIRLERRIKNMNAQIATGIQEQQTAKEKNEAMVKNIELTEEEINSGNETLENSQTKLNQMNSQLEHVRNL